MARKNGTYFDGGNVVNIASKRTPLSSSWQRVKSPHTSRVEFDKQFTITPAGQLHADMTRNYLKQKHDEYKADAFRKLKEKINKLKERQKQ
tara:strand:- start:1096 stop:1368 length:273 start_codon:yes stop_codon:yes gene_type:complete